MNKFTELLRAELAQAGYIECLTMSLLSLKENYTFLRKELDFNECVQIANPKTIEFEIVRTHLTPGLLKTFFGNSKEPLPQRIFEVSDVVTLDPTAETNARNHRHLAVLYLNTSSAFEVVQGILDLVMTKVGAKFMVDYRLQEDESNPMYFPKRGAHVLFKGNSIGSIGVLHPEVLENFKLKYPVTCFEINIEPLFDHFRQQQS
mmetsp:Transcript_17696/g.12629  ORF Transcript_17696/g.12629 Transcript_17696/m.12629 type:complete len:204 (+) Transcript_17696:490-1101(+)